MATGSFLGKVPNFLRVENMEKPNLIITKICFFIVTTKRRVEACRKAIVKSFRNPLIARKRGTTRKTHSREECLMSSGNEEEFDLSNEAVEAVAPFPSAAAAAPASRTAAFLLNDDERKPQRDENDDEAGDMGKFIVKHGCEIFLWIEVQNYSYSFLCLTAGVWRQEMKATLVLEHRRMPSDQMIVIRIPTVCWNLLTMRTKTKVILG